MFSYFMNSPRPQIVSIIDFMAIFETLPISWTVKGMRVMLQLTILLMKEHAFFCP